MLSDLHLGEGRSRHPERFSPMEEFFYDESFARLLDHLQRRYAADPSGLVLVLNGDVLDFLTITRLPDPEPGFEMSSAERRFGLNPTPSKSIFKLDRIVQGHPAFFDALARFAAAGHRIEILRGNHDLEIFFEEVRERLVGQLVERAGGDEAVRARLRFHQWFYLEPGRVYIEHGNQYEASNSIRYPLRPLLPVGKRRGESEPVLDYPLGSLFVRYFYNGVHHIDPYTPKVVSFEHYLEFLRRYNLLDLLRIARRHYPFFLQALGPRSPSGSSGPCEQDEAEQREAFESLDRAAEPRDLHAQLNALKIMPLSASKAGLVKEMTKPILRRLTWTAGVAFVSLYVWLLIFNVIQATPFVAESVFVKAILLAVFSIATMLVLLGLGNHLAHKLRRTTDRSVAVCAQQAERIAELTGVKLVLMGHTHEVDIRRIAGGKATYANSGTWTSVDNPWDRLHPDARRFTFLHVQGDEVQVRRWNDDAGRIDPVPLFDRSEESLPGPSSRSRLRRLRRPRR